MELPWNCTYSPCRFRLAYVRMAAACAGGGDARALEPCHFKLLLLNSQRTRGTLWAIAGAISFQTAKLSESYRSTKKLSNSAAAFLPSLSFLENHFRTAVLSQQI